MYSDHESPNSIFSPLLFEIGATKSVSRLFFKKHSPLKKSWACVFLNRWLIFLEPKAPASAFASASTFAFASTAAFCYFGEEKKISSERVSLFFPQNFSWILKFALILCFNENFVKIKSFVNNGWVDFDPLSSQTLTLSGEILFLSK